MGRFKFLMYDLELAFYTNKEKTIKKEMSEKYFHLNNIMQQMHRKAVSNTTLLKGQSAQRAGALCFSVLKKHGYHYEDDYERLHSAINKKETKVQKKISQSQSQDKPDRKKHQRLEKLGSYQRSKCFYSALSKASKIRASDLEDQQKPENQGF